MSTYSLKGFVVISNLINNTPGQTAVLGELSTWSQTYTKEKGEYRNPTIADNMRIVSVSSKDLATGAVVVDASIADHALTVTKWAYDYLLTIVSPVDRNVFFNAIKAQFISVATNFNFGNIVEFSSTVKMPESLSWSMITGNSNVVNIRLWFSDNAFKAQFDEYEITVIPPIIPLDDFFLSYTNVKNKLAARTFKQNTDLMQAAKGNSPETFLRTQTYNYIFGNDPSTAIPTNWSILVYGARGDNDDAIKNAIIDHILANTTRTRAQWEAILPDLFKSPEFYLFPRWDKMAIEDLSVQAGIFSPLNGTKETITFTKSKLSGIYDNTFIEDKLEIFTHPYESISIVSVGGPNNKTTEVFMSQIYKDYINVSTQSSDFNRMSQKTRDFSVLLEQMLIMANNGADPSPSNPELRLIKRKNPVTNLEMLYVTYKIGNILYLMAHRSNYGV